MLVIQLVQIAVYLREVHILVIIVLQVLHRRRLARRERQAALYQLAEHDVLYTVETDAVEHTVQYQFRAVEKDVVDVGQHAFGHLTLFFHGNALLTE